MDNIYVPILTRAPTHGSTRFYFFLLRIHSDSPPCNLACSSRLLPSPLFALWNLVYFCLFFGREHTFFNTFQNKRIAAVSTFNQRQLASCLTKLQAASINVRLACLPASQFCRVVGPKFSSFSLTFGRPLRNFILLLHLPSPIFCYRKSLRGFSLLANERWQSYSLWPQTCNKS